MTHPSTDPEVRRTGLGGSDMPVVLGLSQWKSPFELWLEKLGRLPPFAGNEATWFGNQLEHIIAVRWAEDHGKAIHKVNVTARRKDVKWAMVHIDRKVESERACLEVKTTVMMENWGEEGTDQVPPHILPQCHHQMWVVNLQRCYVAVAFLHRRKIAYYIVERSERWDDLLRTTGEAFWKHVTEQTEPPVDFGARGIVNVLKKGYGVEDGDVMDFNSPAQELHDMLTTLNSRSGAYTKAAEELKAELLHMMGKSWVGRLPDGTFYRRQMTKRKGFTVEPSEVLDFRHIKKAPKGVEPKGE